MKSLSIIKNFLRVKGHTPGYGYGSRSSKQVCMKFPIMKNIKFMGKTIKCGSKGEGKGRVCGSNILISPPFNIKLRKYKEGGIMGNYA